jgi:DNA-binding MarR family transcriptional regulator
VRRARKPQAADFKRDWRRLNTGRLLYEGYELYNATLLKSLNPAGFPEVRNAHFNLLRHLDANGTRMSDLASRANFTKPAITGLVRACQDLDLVTVEQSSEDARARMVRFSPRGLQLMRQIQQIQVTIERELAARLGDEAYGQLRSALLALANLRDAV